MNLDAGQLDSIVREVVRRLAALDDQARVAARDPIAATEPSPPTLVLAERVVTTSCLSGRLTGIARVQVSAQAVVTPLVADFLRERGIQLDRQLHGPSAHSSVHSSSRRTLAVASAASQLPWLTALMKDLPTDWQHFGDADEAFATVASGRHAGAIVLTPDWAQIVCHANRHARLRAASVHSLPTLRHACQTLNANVIAMDITHISLDQVEQMIRAYVAWTATADHLSSSSVAAI